jgi:2-desacetyl-2-hydroxyethyl bacteriochlorophyllide A dehydrogenase
MLNRAIFIEEPYKVKLVDLPMPTPAAGEITMKVLYAGVCGSDFKVYLGKMNNVTYPKIAGHEFAGEITAAGEGVTEYKVGQIVTSTPYYGCCTCYCCRMGFYNCCQNNKTMGVGCDGGFRNYINIPVSKVCDGKGLDARTLALIEPFSNSLNLVKRLKVKAGDRVLIFGSGPIGVFALIAMKARGATVHMADTSDARLKFALDMGADGVVNVKERDIIEYVREQTGDEGFGITVEAVGSGDVFLRCIDTVSFHGKVCVIGMTTTDYTFNHSIISYKEIELIGARNSTREDFLDNIESISSGAIQKDFINKMITAEYNMEDAVQMYKELETTYTSNMKVVIKF